MAQCGIASRRKSEEIILQGRVKVNGLKVIELGHKINIDSDNVMIDDKLITLESRKICIALNKPVGYVTTSSDQFGRKTVLDLIKGINERIYPIGRLDYDTSGLLLLTNDGNLAFSLTHPKHEVNKKYLAMIKGLPTEDELNRFRQGLDIDGYITSNAKIKIIENNSNLVLVEIEIHEGRNRQIRKMCEKINHPVISLKRVSIGKIKLNNLEIGTWRFLTEEEVEYLRKE